MSTERPNVVWMLADDAGMPDFGCYGHPYIQTPNVDALAANGARFTRAFVTAPQCSPSRSSIYVGKYAHTTGTEDLHQALHPSETIIPERLQGVGYHTGMLGKLHLGKPTRSKFDFSGRVGDWLRFMHERPKDRPFFLGIGFLEPHRPYRFDTRIPQYTADEVIVPDYLPDTRKVRLDLARYYTAITRLDHKLGQLVDFLDQEGLGDNTFIVFSSDHGQPFPRAKGFLYDPGIRVPLVARWPGHIPQGTRHGLASLIDLGATTLEIAGLAVPEALPTRSMWAQFQDPDAPGRDAIFAERNWHDIDDHVRAIRTERYKYIRNAYFDTPPALPADVHSSPSFRSVRQANRRGELTESQAQILQSPRPEEELYDLTNDPQEFNNLVADPAYRETVETLRQRVHDWSEATDDVSPENRRRRRFAYRLG